MPEILARAQLRVNRFVTALLAPDGVRASRVVGASGEGVVRALAKAATDGVNRREVQHIEAHVLDHRQTRMHVIEGDMTLGILGDRAGKRSERRRGGKG